MDCLFSYFEKQRQFEKIRDWRQRIEDREAQSARRPPYVFDTMQAVKDCRLALMTDTAHSQSAKHLLRELNGPAEAKLTVAEAWRLHNPDTRPTSLTPNQQAYVKAYDQWRNRQKVGVPVSEVQSQSIGPQGQRQDQSALTVNPPQEGRCSKCGGLMDVDDYLNDQLGVRNGIVWRCVNCGRREDQRIPMPKVPHIQRPCYSHRDDEIVRGLSNGIKHFMEMAKAKKLELKETLKATEKKQVRKQQLVLRALGTVLQTIQRRYSPASADAVMDADPANPIPALYATYELLMLRAEQRGLGSDDYIKNWFNARKRIGDTAALSSARRGLQKLVAAPYSEIDEMDLDLEIIKMGPLPSRTIAKKLAERGLLHNGKPLSHVSVNERRKLLQKQLPWFRPNRNR